MLFRRLHICLTVFALVICAIRADAFTYQGKLTDSTGQPANGTCYMEFRLFDAVTDGVQVGSTVRKSSVAVSDGLFSVELDFGAALMGTSDRWLQVCVGSQTLTPRTKITAVPRAAYAESVPWTGITGMPSALTPGGPAGGDLAGTYPNPLLAKAESSLAKVSGGLMTASGGKIGIGTPVPAGLLHVAGTAVDQSQTSYWNSVSTSPTYWQSFTAGMTGLLSAVEIRVGHSSGAAWTGTLNIRSGEGPSGAILSTQTVGGTYVGFLKAVLPVPISLNAGQVYTIEISSTVNLQIRTAMNGNPYPGGRLSTDPAVDGYFRTFMVSGTPLYVDADDYRVGISTDDPRATLHVAGRARVDEFQMGSSTTAGYVLTADASGVGTWQPTTVSGITAGGDLEGTYPNPTIGDDKVGHKALASDSDSLVKVSGGTFTLRNGKTGIGEASPSGILHVSGYSGNVDQQCSTGTGGYSIYGSVAQSFTAGVSGKLFAIELPIYIAPNWYDRILLIIRAGDGTAGNILSLQPVTADSVATHLFLLPTPVSVSAGSVYTFEFRNCNYGVSFDYSPTDSYPGGRCYINGGASGTVADMHFKTYVGSGRPALTVQPMTLNVGIGTSSPQDLLAVNGALRVDQNSTNGNTLGPGAIRFGGGATGEGIACNRSNGTAGENQWGLDFYTHNVRRMSITLDGNVGIGTTNPAYKLHVNGSVAGVGAYNQLSDARYKTNIEPIPSALDKVESLRGVTFDWKADQHPEIDFGEGRQAGVLAQEVQQVLPEAVTKSPDGTYSVSYSSLVPLLIEAIKEQQKTIERLESRDADIDALKAEIEALKASKSSK